MEVVAILSLLARKSKCTCVCYFRAGLQAGDVILEINGKDVQAAGNIYEAVSTGEEMLLTVKRHRQTLKLRVTPLQVN